MRNNCIAFMMTCAIAAAQTADSTTKVLQQIGLDQRLNQQVPLDLTFRDENGHDVKLSEYFGDKPVILTLVYYRCPMLCNLVLNGLTQAMRILSFDAGREFRVVTVSIDPTETPAMAKAKKENYIHSYKRAGAEKSWHFLTGDEASIKQLARAVGFRYVYDPASKQFAHASGIMVLTPKGKIARYLYGIEYAPRDLQFALMEAAGERIGSPVDQIIMYCYHYDPTTGKYGLAIMNVIRLGGVTTVLMLGGLIVTMIRRERRAARQKSVCMEN